MTLIFDKHEAHSSQPLLKENINDLLLFLQTLACDKYANCIPRGWFWCPEKHHNYFPNTAFLRVPHHSYAKMQEGINSGIPLTAEVNACPIHFTLRRLNAIHLISC